MDERYSRIYSLPENLYAQGAPVVVSAGALLKDNETNWLLGQLKLRSISNKPIKLVKVELTCFDAMGREVSPAIVFDYLDLNVFRGSEFGSQTPIRISNAAIRGYTVKHIMHSTVTTDCDKFPIAGHTCIKRYFHGIAASSRTVSMIRYPPCPQAILRILPKFGRLFGCRIDIHYREPYSIFIGSSHTDQV